MLYYIIRDCVLYIKNTMMVLIGKKWRPFFLILGDGPNQYFR